MNVRVELVTAHRPRDLAGPQLDTERFAQRASGAEHALCVRSDTAPPRDVRALGFHRLLLELFDPSRQRPVVGRVRRDPPNGGGHQQVAFDVTQRPDEELETGLEQAIVGVRVVVIVSIEDDEARETGLRPTAPAKIVHRSRRPSTAQDYRAAFEGPAEDRGDVTRPARQDLAIPRPLDVENEAVFPVLAGSIVRREPVRARSSVRA